MCQTFYFEHDDCTCIYIPANFTPCAAYSLAHAEGKSEPPNPFADPEDPPTEPDPFADPEDPFADPVPEANPLGVASRPKLLTQAYGGLDFTYDDVDFVSVDVSGARAPKGLECSEGFAPRLAHRAEGGFVVCALCDRPDVLELVGWMGMGKDEHKHKDVDMDMDMGKDKDMDLGKYNGKEEEEERKGKEKEKGKPKEKGIRHKTALVRAAVVKSFKVAVGFRAPKPGDSSADYSAIGEGESSSSTRPARPNYSIPYGP